MSYVLTEPDMLIKKMYIEMKQKEKDFTDLEYMTAEDFQAALASAKKWYVKHIVVDISHAPEDFRKFYEALVKKSLRRDVIDEMVRLIG